MISKNTACRACDSEKLHLFLDLSDQPPANTFISKDQIGREASYPLKTYVCEDCNLVQLIDVVDLDELFQNYVYFTSGAGLTTPKHFTDYAVDMINRFGLTPESLVVELGSNDGLLLRAFAEKKVTKVLGVDPAKNVAEAATKSGIETIAQPWSKGVAESISSTHGSADLIIGNNVVAHINDHRDLFGGIKKLLAPEGVFVFEAPYLLDMFDELSFDTIYHEHLSCLSLRPIKRLIEEVGLEVIDMETKSVQGLSMRVFISHKGSHTVSSNVQKFVDKEIAYGCDTVSAYHQLATRVEERKDTLVSLMADLKRSGKRIAGYGAPAKGNTLLNYMNIGPETLEYLTEGLPSKIGKLSPGMNIPVIDIADARLNPPDYFLMLAWNYADSILENESKMRASGTKFIIPIGKNIVIV